MEERAMSCPIDSSLSLLQADGITLDPRKHLLNARRQWMRLTPMESRLLAVFMTHPDQLLTREFLMREVWDTSYCGDTRTLEVHVCWLRKKLGDDATHPRYLITVRGRGYRFVTGTGIGTRARVN
jgi:DNA-binding response OmpR family regulator